MKSLYSSLVNFPFNFIVIPAIIIYIAYQGSQYVQKGLKPWYNELKKPFFTPPGKLIGAIWTFLYTLIGLAILWYWNVPVVGWFKYVVAVVLLANGYYNLIWNKHFFTEHNIPKSLDTMKYLNTTGLVATVLIAVHSPIAAFMLLPYIIWVGFATFLTQQIELLNKNK